MCYFRNTSVVPDIGRLSVANSELSCSMSSLKTCPPLPSKKYAVLSFGKNKSGQLSVELALTSWIVQSRGKLYCKFPESNVNISILNRCLKDGIIAKKSWQKFECEIICEADTFDQGMRRLKRSYETENVASTDCEKFEQNEHISPVELNEKTYRELLSTSTPMKQGSSLNKKRTGVSSALNGSVSSLSPPEMTDRRNKGKHSKNLNDLYSSSSSAHESTSDESPRNTHSSEKSAAETRQISSLNGDMSELDEKQNAQRYQAQIEGSPGEIGLQFSSMKYLEDMKNEMKKYIDSAVEGLAIRLEANLSSVRRSVSYDLSSKFEGLKVAILEIKSTNAIDLSELMRSFGDITFPINTLEDFLKLDGMLKENREMDKKMIELISFYCIGQSSSKKCIQEAIPKIIGKNIQQLYSGKGKAAKDRVQKKDFSATQFYACFEVAILAKYGQDSEECKKLITKVGTWLSQAGDRDGGRKNRQT